MKKKNSFDSFDYSKTLEELIAFEDKIEKLGSDARKSLNTNYSINVDEYLSSIEKLVDEHKNNIQNLFYTDYENITQGLQ